MPAGCKGSTNGIKGSTNHLNGRKVEFCFLRLASELIHIYDWSFMPIYILHINHAPVVCYPPNRDSY